MDIKTLLDELELDGIVGCDWESYWAKDYTLRGMATSEYIYDERFKAHCCSVQWHTEKKAHVLNPDEMRDWASQVDWRRTGFLAHHTHFDGLIASRHFDIHPKFLFCSMSMARPIMPVTVGGSLVALCAAFNRRSKKRGAVLLNTQGIRDLDKKQYKQMAAYAGDDIDDCWFLFNKFLPFTSLREFHVIDRTIRMFTEPRIVFNEAMLQKLYDEEVKKKADLLKLLKTTKKQLRGAESFADMLRAVDVEPPMKVSKPDKHGNTKFIYAFAKTDLAFKNLLGHKKKRVRDLVRGRYALSTNIMESRSKRFLKRAPWGPQPVYLNYALALTLRWTGGDKSNYQNLKRGSELREAIEAPKGHELIIVDSAQIEARLNARFAGQMDKVEQFRKQDMFGREEDDVYAMTASKIFGREIIKSRDPGERFIGKVCVAEGTPVLCSRGWIAIESVLPTDKVWDGVNWVCQQGVVNNGLKPVLQSCGVWLTPDHLVWSGTQWRRADSMLDDLQARCQALAFAAANLPSPDTWRQRKDTLKPFWSVVTASAQNIQLLVITLKRLGLRVAAYVHRLQQNTNAIGSTLKQCLRTIIGGGYSTASLQHSSAVVTTGVRSGLITASVGSVFAPSGRTTVSCSYAMCKHFLAGTTRLWRWTAFGRTGITSRGTSVSSRAQLMPPTSDASEILRRSCRVYDLSSCGPNNRYVVLGDAGPLLVHNCDLQLGYQAGAPRYAHGLRTGVAGKVVDIDDDDAKMHVAGWRHANQFICAGWRETNNLVKAAFIGKTKVEHRYGVSYEGRGEHGYMHLPDGMSIRYAEVEYDEDGGISYLRRLKRSAKGETRKRTRLYGGLLVENRTQALSRSLLADWIVEITLEFPDLQLVTTTHDEVVFVAKIGRGAKVKKRIVEIMTTPPAWMPDLPLNVDWKVSRIYEKG